MRLELDHADLKPLIRAVLVEVLAELDMRGLQKGDDAAIPEARAAEMLGVARHQLRDARRRGEITCSRIGKKVVYTKSELTQYLNRTREVR